MPSAYLALIMALQFVVPHVLYHLCPLYKFMILTWTTSLSLSLSLSLLCLKLIVQQRYNIKEDKHAPDLHEHIQFCYSTGATGELLATYRYLFFSHLAYNITLQP